MKEVFSAAKECNPEAVLLINDFNTSVSYENLLEELLEADVPISAVGIQSHQHQGYWGREKLEDVLERFSRFGIPLHFTENTKFYEVVNGAKAENAITDKTKVLVLPFPNNPTGAILERKDLEQIAKVVEKHDLFVLSDEIYSELTYLEKDVSIVNIPGMRERTVLINGFSKSHAMTGWRLGYACAPKEIIEQMLKIHQFAIMCAPTTSQYAAVTAIRDCDKEVADMREEYNARRRYLLHRFEEMGLKCFEPFGAFYMFPSIKEFNMTSDEFATRLLKSKKVAVVPGNAFGACGEGFLRISYAYSLSNLKKALDRIEEFVNELREEQHVS